MTFQRGARESFDLSAAGLRADGTAWRLLRSPRREARGVVADRTTVERRGGGLLGRGPRTVRSIQVALGRYPRDRLELPTAAIARRTRAAQRGIAIGHDALNADEWVTAVTDGLREEAARDAARGWRSNGCSRERAAAACRARAGRRRRTSGEQQESQRGRSRQGYLSAPSGSAELGGARAPSTSDLLGRVLRGAAANWADAAGAGDGQFDLHRSRLRRLLPGPTGGLCQLESPVGARWSRPRPGLPEARDRGHELGADAVVGVTISKGEREFTEGARGVRRRGDSDPRRAPATSGSGDSPRATGGAVLTELSVPTTRSFAVQGSKSSASSPGPRSSTSSPGAQRSSAASAGSCATRSSATTRRASTRRVRA